VTADAVEFWALLSLWAAVSTPPMASSHSTHTRAPTVCTKHYYSILSSRKWYM